MCTVVFIVSCFFKKRIIILKCNVNITKQLQFFLLQLMLDPPQNSTTVPKKIPQSEAFFFKSLAVTYTCVSEVKTI